MNDAWKKRFNILITYYRKKYLKETSDKKWVQKNFYYNEKEHYAVCSNNTYCHLEHNRILADDAVYLFALKKLEKQFTFDQEIENRFLYYIESLAHEIEYGHTEKLAQLFEELVEECGTYQSYIYYEELFYALQLIKDYYEGRYDGIDDEDYRKLTIMMDIFPHKLKYILMELLYCYANMRERCVVDELLSLYDYEHSEYLPNRITYLMYNRLNSKNMMSLIKKGQAMIQELKQANNYLLEIDLYIMLANITENIDVKYSEDCFYYALNIIDKNEIPERVKLSTYLNAGYYYIKIKQYGVALNYLLKAIAIKEIMRPKNFACCIFCYHMLGIEAPEEFYALDIEANEDDLDVAIYEFLKHVNEYSLEQNVRYLKKNVYKGLRHGKNLYVVMIERELYRISRPKGKYHLYHNFCDKFLGN